jgi:RepB DNA-primase from phage plasmid
MSMNGLDEALRMLDVFASVGTERFDLTHINIDGEKRGFRAAQTLPELKASLPKLFPGAEKRQNNIIVRPHGAAAQLIQLDDLDASSLERTRPAAFLILTTSPDNHQAWLAVSPPGDADFARRVRKGCAADISASGATRVAGTANFKRKYEPDFPIVGILDATPGLTVTKEQLETLGLVAAPEPARQTLAPPFRASRRGRAQVWPNYQRCVDGAPVAKAHKGNDRSMADFVWCMTAIDWGFGVEATAEKLMEESGKAREKGRDYAMLTARNAATEVEKNRGGQGRGKT